MTLDRGSTVLLYTDGLIERRDADLDADWSGCGCADGAGRPRLDELLDELIERLVHGRPEDDVAIVAVRLHGRTVGGRPSRPQRRAAGRAAGAHPPEVSAVAADRPAHGP